MEFDEIGGGRSSIEEAVAAALSYLDSVDPASAADAQVGWEGLRSISPPAGPTQNSVQTFLWLHLSEIADESDRAWDIARALADLLDRLGHARYADIARSARTRTLLESSDVSERQQQMLDAVEESGIGPPNTDLITWQETPEGAEAAVAGLIGETLEVATIAGEFAPTRIDGPPLRQSALAAKRRRLTDSVLRSERSGGVLLEQLLDHRMTLWTTYSPPRVELYRDLAVTVHDAAEPAYSCVRRLEGMLAILGDGVELTDRGYLPRAVVERAVATLWRPSEWPFPPGEEIDTAPVLRVRRLLRRLGLVRRHHGRLLPTAQARGMSADRMWTMLLDRFVGADYHPDTIAAEVVFAEIARGGRPSDTTGLLTEILTAEGWTHRDGGGEGEPVPVESVESLADDVLADITALARLDSPEGKRLAAALLRHRLLHTQIPAL